MGDESTVLTDVRMPPDRVGLPHRGINVAGQNLQWLFTWARASAS
jgi:hypothetical protein